VSIEEWLLPVWVGASGGYPEQLLAQATCNHTFTLILLTFFFSKNSKTEKSA
jgi:hypothetical protein